jgi:uncharacterized protein (DUF488 family)
MTNTIFSIGHSTRKIQHFIDILKNYKIENLVDIRSVPKSKRNPQFTDFNLSFTLNESGIKYEHLKSLGGLRKPTQESVNLGWRNESFRGYADYMQTSEFEIGLRKLISLGSESVVVIMCAEAVPWRCHRNLVGDALVIREFDVIDIIDSPHSKSHELTKFAKVDGLKITYPRQDQEL